MFLKKFMGQYRHTVDPKGRVTIPARYRELIGESAIITQDFDRNLVVYPEPIFAAMADQVSANTSITDPNARDLKRLLFSNADLVTPDGNGRILIPSFLREKNDLGSEVVLSGVGDYFEIWSSEEWDQRESLQDAAANVDRFAGQPISTSQRMSPSSGESRLPHEPVLYHEIIHALHPQRGKKYVDATLGAGGHAWGILEGSSPDGMLLGLDLDPQALALAGERLAGLANEPSW